MIAERQLVLEANDPPAQGAIRRVANGHSRNSSFYAPGTERGPPELEQPVRIAWPNSEFRDAADQHDLERLIAGDDQALQSLMKRHSETLYSQLLRMLRDKRDAQDSLLEHLAGYTFIERNSTSRTGFPPGCTRSHSIWRATISGAGRDSPNSYRWTTGLGRRMGIWKKPY